MKKTVQKKWNNMKTIEPWETPKSYIKKKFKKINFLMHKWTGKIGSNS